MNQGEIITLGAFAIFALICCLASVREKKDLARIKQLQGKKVVDEHAEPKPHVI